MAASQLLVARIPVHKLKAIVLLSEISYLKENIINPRRYFPVLKTKRVLSDEQCENIKGQLTAECRVQRFIEYISLEERGFDVFTEALVHQKVRAYVARYLRRKLDKISSQG